MKKLFFVLTFLLVLLIPVAYAAKTTSVAQIDEWAAVAQNTVRKGATYADVSSFYGSTLHVDMALTSTTAHDGTKIWVQASSNTTGDEDWYTLAEDFGPLGTANPEALAGAEAPGAEILEVASTTGYEADETRYIFILDDTVADSELCTLISHEATPSVTVLDGITNAHDASDSLFNIANTYIYAVGIEVQRIRVIVDNTFDPGGSQVHTRTRISNVTGL